MKKLLLILMLLPLLSMGQMSKEELPDNLYSVNLQLLQKPNKQKDVHSGYALMLGGGMFTLLGLATPNEGEIVNGKYQQRPNQRIY
jgi:hypothetical protein